MKLSVRNLTKNIDGTPILNKISYTFQQGRIYGLTGRKGCGKSLLFRCLCKEESYEKGMVRIEKNGSERKTGLQDFGCVYEKPEFPGYMTGREFLDYYMDIHHIPHDAASVEEHLKFIGMDKHQRGQLVRTYTPGLTGLLQLLCIYITGPSIILIEGGAWGTEDIDKLSGIIDELKKDHILIISSADTEFIRQISDEILVLDNGSISSELGGGK
ncbi:MAG: ATP-binding cassette domain-containing protein [Butyrivibrio sp.]